MSTQIILKNYPSEIVEKIIELENSATDLFTPPFNVSEIFKFIEQLGKIIGSTEGITKTIVKDTLDELWDYYNSKFQLTRKLDELIKLPAIIEPFDEKAIELLIGWAIKLSVGLLKIPE